MTYRCGMGAGMARFGFEEGPPHIICDGCGTTLLARTRSGGAPEWLLSGKAPRGWRMQPIEDGYCRKDWCPKCVELYEEYRRRVR